MQSVAWLLLLLMLVVMAVAHAVSVIWHTHATPAVRDANHALL